jgi:hypothetical protein
MEKSKKMIMKYLLTFESYTFEDFTHSDMEDVKELLEEGLTPEQIAIELDFSLDKVKQIISSLENKNIESGNKIYIPREYSGVIMELGEEVNPNDIILLYNKIVEEGTPLVSYSQYGTEGKFYNEDDDEIPTDVILDELNYAIGLSEKKAYKGGLDKWFKEKWVDISKTNKDGSHPPCGRSDTDKGGYPKCRKVRVAARMTDKQKKASVSRKRKVEKEGSKGSGRKPNYAK